jgi:hypothetical protein
MDTAMVWMETRRRAKRFPIATSLSFREHGQTDWREASTVNFSHSGVLFRISGPLPCVGCAVDFVVTLPINGITPAPRVRCTGHVVRQEDGGGGGSSAVAVVIDGYTFESWHRA